MTRAMDGDRPGTSHAALGAGVASVRLAPSRWTTCGKRLLLCAGQGAQVAHTAHSANYYGQKGTTGSRTTEQQAATTTTRSGEV